MYNLTIEGKSYVSCFPPEHLPEENFSFVEIEFSEKLEIKGKYNFNGKTKESILSNIDIEFLLTKLNFFLQRKDIDLTKIRLNFVENEVKDEVNKIFIILLSSYLIYFDFLELPFYISLDLLKNKMLRYFTNFSPRNIIEESWLEQVSNLHRWFSLIFEDDINNNNKQIDIKQIEKEVNKGIIKINKEVDILVKEVKQFKKRMLSDMKKLIK